MAVFDRLMDSQLPRVALYTGALTRLVLRAYEKTPAGFPGAGRRAPAGCSCARYAGQELGVDLPQPRRKHHPGQGL